MLCISAGRPVEATDTKVVFPVFAHIVDHLRTQLCHTLHSYIEINIISPSANLPFFFLLCVFQSYLTKAKL